MSKTGPRGPNGLPTAVRLARYFSAPESGCWEWTGAITRLGYGNAYVGGRTMLAHRAVYEALVGPVPNGLTLDHLCRNRGCVNPAHLEPVTHRENVLRGEGFAARHARKTHCPRGHPYDEKNTEWYRGGRYCRACRTAAPQ
jgi:hypothetical protein